MPAEKSSRTSDLPRRIKAILASKGLTLRQVSQTSEKLYGRSSPFFLPHNLYYELGLRTFTPSLQQVFALSRISKYRLSDWLRVFGFDLANLTRLQLLLPSNRTVLLDSSLDDPESWVPWFESKAGHAPHDGIVPIGRLLYYSPQRRIASLSDINNRNFLYAKLGRQDAFSFPDLLPGSIVRVNPHWNRESFFRRNASIPDHFFLIAHSKGLCCCRLQASGSNAVVPISTRLPYAQVELQIPAEVSILGIVDAEIRPLLKPEQPEVSEFFAKRWRPAPLSRPPINLGQLLRDARTRRGLSFRETSVMSRQIANFLGDQRYFASPGSLSDYETFDVPPRHIHKAITLCAVYALNWSMFLRSAGLPLEETGPDFMCDRLLDRGVPAKMTESEETARPKGGLFSDLLKPWNGEVPLFLRAAASHLSGISHVSLNDVFYVVGEPTLLPGNLHGGFLAIVNRRKKTPVHWRSKPLWQQPLYVLLRRDGTYVCAFCSLENDSLILHSYTQGYHRSEQLRNRHDAEVIGQIVALARKVSG